MQFLAIDCGTTNRRIFRIDRGQAVLVQRDDRGASAFAADAYPAEMEALRARFGDMPIVLAGMAGSNVGWQAVPYVQAPAGLADLAAALRWIDDRTAIVPGLCWRDEDGRVDVMRGEEVQLLGAAAAGMVPEQALLCQPGTHCKWATLAGDRVTRFTTAMTGELFALLRAHSLLKDQLGSLVVPGAAFLAGVAQGRQRDLAASLFGIRARGLLGLLDPVDAASFASGLLIGADVAARLAPGAVIHVLAERQLGELYLAAISALGGAANLLDSQTAFVAGITRLWDIAS